MSGARHLLGIALAAAVVGCSAPPPPAWPADLQLPETASLGAYPPLDGRAQVRLDAECDLALDGRPVADHMALQEGLRVHADAAGRDDSGVSLANVVVGADARAPMICVAQVLIACADPNVQIPRIWFAAAEPEGSGAIASFLPSDSW